MTPGIIKKLYHTTPVGLTDEDKQEVYPITATSAVYSAPGESSFPNMPLDNILDALNQGYQYMGKASPSTNPGVFNHKVFYLASETGTYSYFDDITVSGLTVLKTDGNGWSADAFNITGGGGGGLTTAYIGTTMVQETPAPQQLSGISQLNLTSGARIYFGETAYIELNQYGFHFSEGIYSDSFVAAGGIGSGGGGGGGGSYTPGNGISIVNGEISVKIGTGLAFDANGNLTATGGGSYVLPIASASTLGGIKVGSGLSIDSSGVLSAIGGTEGTVTSITLNSGTGITVSNSGTAITTSGSRTISINSSYRNKIDHGDTAYSWGNHAAAGYADASVVNAALAEKQNVISDLETIRSNASRGNTAYGWGNHALAGYAMAADLTSLETRVISIEDWFEIVTVNGQQALHAKSGRAIYSDSWVAAGGIGSGSSSGGTDLNRVWDSLTNNTDKPNVKINIAHIPDITTAKITDLNTWIAGKGYLTVETDPTVPAWAKASSKPSYSLSEISGTSDLQSIEALTGTSGLLRKTAANTWSLDTTTYLASGTTLDSIMDGTTRKLSDYVTLGTAQTITGVKTISANMFVGGDIIPSTDLGPSLGYSNLRFANLNVRTIGSLLEINFKSQNNSAQTGYLTFKEGWMVLRSGANIGSSYKQINFHETNGFYPVQSGVNLGYNSATSRWANIYGVNENLTGDLTLASTSHIDIGPLRIEYDDTHKAIHITKISSSDNNTYGLYADGFIAAGGIGQTS